MGTSLKISDVKVSDDVQKRNLINDIRSFIRVCQIGDANDIYEIIKILENKWGMKIFERS